MRRGGGDEEGRIAEAMVGERRNLLGSTLWGISLCDGSGFLTGPQI